MQPQGSLLYLTGQHSNGEVINIYSQFTTLQQNPPLTSCKEQTTPLANKLNLLACMISRKTQEQQTFQQRALGSSSRLRVPQQPKYMTTIIGKWKVFCRERGIDTISRFLDQPIEFLTKCFESSVGYSSVSTAK